MEISEIKNNDQWLWWNVAMYYKRLNRLKDAILLCKKAIDFVPNSTLIKNLWAHLIFDFVVVNIDLLTGGKLVDAWKKFDELLTSDYKYLTKEKVFYTFLKMAGKENNLSKKKDFLEKIELEP